MTGKMEQSDLTQPSGRKILKVHELTTEIRQILEQQFSDLWIEGEVADLVRPQSGHLYFTLKDSIAKIKAIVFRSHLRFLRFAPKAGESVLIRGRISLYEARGEYQLICDYIEPRGLGALQAAFERLKEELRQEGLFDTERKRPLPRYPAKIALITSSTGAAIQDILKVVREAAFQCQIILYSVPVQGWDAAQKIAYALDEINRYSNRSPYPIDLLILARGGGSLEDLWAFNEEPVARAIARSKIPVISAIGHESDSTISDYVADIRAPTPSIAAEIVVKQGMALIEALRAMHQALIDRMMTQVEAARNRIATTSRLLVPPRHKINFHRDQIAYLKIRLFHAMRRQIEERQAGLRRSCEGLSHLSPIGRLEAFRKRLEPLRKRLSHEGRRAIADRKGRLEKLMAQLNLLSPLNILGRGYSITRKLPALAVVRSAAEVAVGEHTQITLHHGRLICSVEQKEEG